jgi:hypothetical protein
VLHRPFYFTASSPYHVVEGKPTFDEHTYPTSSPSGNALSQRQQGLSSPPRSYMSSPIAYGLDPSIAYGLDDHDIDLEPTSSRQPGLASLRNYIDELGSFAGLDDPPGNYEDMRNQRKLIAIMRKKYVGPAGHPAMHNLGEPTNLTADLMDEQQHAFNSHLSTYGVGSSVSTSINGRMSDVGSDIYQPIEPPWPISQLETDLGLREQLATEAKRASLTFKELEEKLERLSVAARGLTKKSSLPGERWRSGSRLKGGDRLRRQGNPYASSLNTKPYENRRKILRVRIKDQDVLACPDSGSEENIISEACALEHGFRIRRKPKDKRKFQVGNGDSVRSIGRVWITVGLPGSSLWQKKRRFYVLKNCPVPMVIGMKFLREAEILTRHRHLLESCPAEMSNISSLLWIGSPRNRLRCTVDGRQLVATADTGSDFNLMSLACAEREGFRIDKRIEARTQIAVGNGKVIDTLGQVYVSNLTLDWREPEAEPPEQSPRGPANDVPLEPDPQGGAYSPQGGDDDLYIAFHVIENLPCDVVFGQKFLYDTDAFNKCPELLDIPPTKQNRQFEKHKQQYEFMIFVNNIFPRLGFSKKPKLAVDIKEQHERNWHAERYRRSNNTEEKIALLPLDKQEAARRAEKKSIQDWKSKHDDCRFCGTRSAT